MDIKPVLETSANFAKEAYAVAKTVVCWTGHKIQTGFIQYVIPAAEKLYALGIAALRAFGNQLKSGPGAVFALAIGLFLAGITAFKLADRKAYEDNGVARALWKTVGVAAFLGATAATSFGIGALLVV